jgi:hypothetical protein
MRDEVPNFSIYIIGAIAHRIRGRGLAICGIFPFISGACPPT